MLELFVFISATLLIGSLFAGRERIICFGMLAAISLLFFFGTLIRESNDSIYQHPSLSPTNTPVLIAPLPVNPDSISAPQPTIIPQVIDSGDESISSEFLTSYSNTFFLICLSISFLLALQAAPKKKTQRFIFGITGIFLAITVGTVLDTTSLSEVRLPIISASWINIIFSRISQELSRLPSPFNNPILVIIFLFYIFTLMFLVFVILKIFSVGYRSFSTNFFETLEDKTIREERKELDEAFVNKVLKEKKIEGRDITILMYKNLQYLRDYYDINRNQTVQSFWFSVGLTMSGFLLIVCALYLLRNGENIESSISLVTGFSGIILQLIGGSALLLYNRSINQFDRFFAALVRDQDTILAVELCNSLREIDDIKYTRAIRYIIEYLASRELPSYELLRTIKEQKSENSS